MADWGILFRPSSKRILDLLLAGSQSLSDLARETQLSKPTLTPQLKALEELGVIAKSEDKTTEGREVRYTINPASVHLEFNPENGTAISWASQGRAAPDFPLTSQIVDKALRAEILLALRRVRAELSHVFVILFGSVARGEATWKSDIDLLFVLPDDAANNSDRRERIKDILALVQEDVAHAVRAHFATRSEFLSSRRAIESDAAEEGLVLHASDEESELWRRMTRHASISI